MNPKDDGPRPDNRIAIYMVATIVMVGALMAALLGGMQMGLGRLTSLFEGEDHRVLKLVLISFGLLTAFGAAVNFYQTFRARKQRRDGGDQSE